MYMYMNLIAISDTVQLPTLPVPENFIFFFTFVYDVVTDFKF